MMPDKPLTVATYAAGASLAAITLVYVFGPTFFLDDGSSQALRKKGAVGLSNPANDCFINSVLQALAGLGDLRVYLIKELYRRVQDGPEVYKITPADRGKGTSVDQLYRLAGLREGCVTQALKDMLDQLNERPLSKKTISAGPFIASLEYAFGTHVSRRQQDAQEMLQIIAERLCEEYHAGLKARTASRAKTPAPMKPKAESTDPGAGHVPVTKDSNEQAEIYKQQKWEGSNVKRDRKPLILDETSEADSNIFPFEGKLESRIECQTCHFIPKPSNSSFVILTLNVPQKNSTSLDNCFDGLLKQEFIDDYKCDRCRLEHVLQIKNSMLSKLVSIDEEAALKSDISKIKHAIENDPEVTPTDVEMPDVKLAPKRRIAKHARISSYPQILAIHLSRSIFDPGSYSIKNLAKVNFPEILSLGGLLEKKIYRLRGLVTHQGGHNRGHYETFRRQVLKESSSPSPMLDAVHHGESSSPPDGMKSGSPTVSPPPVSVELGNLPRDDPIELYSPDLNGLTVPTESSRASSMSKRSDPDISSAWSMFSRRCNTSPRVGPSAGMGMSRLRRKKPKNIDRWWRVSDDKIRECGTSEVLAMQKDAYLLFYEMERTH